MSLFSSEFASKNHVMTSVINIKWQKGKISYELDQKTKIKCSQERMARRGRKVLL